MQNLSFRYTQWMNKRRRRTGHLFQGRYAAILVDDCIHVVCKHYALTEADLAIKDQRRKPSEARAVIGWTGRQSGGFTLSEAARRFGRDVATMSLAVRRLQDRADKDEGLKGRLQLIFDECQDIKA